MPIVVTGFEPFGAHSANPSAILVEGLGDWPNVVAEVLPTSYERAGHRVEALLDQHKPHAILMLGLSARARGLVLERRARNWDDSSALDNDGSRRSGVAIAPTGPESYPATLPLPLLADLAVEAGLGAEMSEDAGGFVCNHVYFRAAHHIVQTSLAARCGFAHVPLVEPSSELQRMRDCIERFVRVLDQDSARVRGR